MTDPNIRAIVESQRAARRREQISKMHAMHEAAQREFTPDLEPGPDVDVRNCLVTLTQHADGVDTVLLEETTYDVAVHVMTAMLRHLGTASFTLTSRTTRAPMSWTVK